MTEPIPYAGAELANDYLDDTLGAPARERVEASAELLAAVEAQRSVRVALRTLPVAEPGTRSAALAAAAAEFTGAAASRSLDGAAGSKRTDELAGRRQRRMRRLGAGAAAAVAAAVVVVAAINLGGSSSDLRSAATAPDSAPFGVEVAAPAAATGEAQGSATTSAGDEPAGTASEKGRAADAGPAAKTDDTGPLLSIDEPGGLLTLPRPAASSAGTVLVAAAPESTPGSATAPTTTDALRPSSVTASEDAGSASASVVDGSQCLGTDEVLLAHIVYRSTPAVAVVDDRRHVRRALDSSTCAVLAEIADRS